MRGANAQDGAIGSPGSIVPSFERVGSQSSQPEAGYAAQSCGTGS